MSSSGTAVISNGVIEYDGVVVGSVANLVCNEGYTPGVNSSNRTCMNDGKWSGMNQTCAPCKYNLLIAFQRVQWDWVLQPEKWLQKSRTTGVISLLLINQLATTLFTACSSGKKCKREPIGSCYKHACSNNIV